MKTHAALSKALAAFASLIGLVSSIAVGMAYAPAVLAAVCPSAIEMNDGWTIATPESVGLEPRQLCAITDAQRSGKLRNLHGVVIARRGHLVFEQYYTGPDRRGGPFLGNVTFRAKNLHDMQSITKSIVGLLYGIAHAQGKVSPVDRSLLDSFPELADLRAEPARARILVKHALTMTMGTDWKKTPDKGNDESQMEVAVDRCRYILNRPIVAAPGERWNYNGGATAVIAELTARGTHRPLLEFAKEQLFGPLGITELAWITNRTGEPLTARGLRLRPRDLAKIGQLVLQRGRWSEQQLVAVSWIEEMTAPQAQPTDPSLRYGYQWWLGSSNFRGAKTPWIAAFGRGGQRLFILPDLELVVAVTAGDYHDPEQGRLPDAILNQFVLPALVGEPHN